ncbi:MAG: hypothetical protein H0V91_01525 [Flavisolibacter sp.]|nr:hypothetical protein [Flavisolibacter sp.]
MKYIFLILIFLMLSCTNDAANEPLIAPQQVKIDSSTMAPRDSIIIPDSTASGVSF